MKDLIIQYLKDHHQSRLDEIIAEKDLPVVRKINNSIIIDYTHLYEFLKGEGRQGVIEKLDQVIDLIQDAIGSLTGCYDMQVRFNNVCRSVPLRELSSKHIDYWTSSNGLIKNMSSIKPRIKEGLLECKNCLEKYNADFTNPKSVPSICKNCKSDKLELIEEKTQFIDHRILKVEEPLELRSHSQTREFRANIDGDLASPEFNINPGDVINFFGVLTVERNESNDKAFFSININNIEPILSTYEDIEISPEDEKEIKKLSSDPEIFNKLIDSLATSISGHRDVKKGLLLQQFGSYEEFKQDGSRVRGDLNILIIGDPGIAKSQILKYISELSPKGFYVSGSTSSAVGLTAAAVKDEITGGWTIEAGPLVLADRGVVCIDELDKLSKKSISKLNEALEQGTVTVAKAGIVQTMNARTSVLAAANPKYSRFDIHKTMLEQIQIPDSTLTRFDLVYALEDTKTDEEDRELALTILNHQETSEGIIDQDLLKKFIAYARRECKPELTSEANEEIANFYTATRRAAKEDPDSKPITPRDLEALKRLTIARARINLREYATVEDAMEGISIYKAALKTLGLEPETAGAISNVKSQTEIKNIEIAEEIIKRYKAEYGDIIPKGVHEDIKSDIQGQCKLLDESEIVKIYAEAWSNIKNAQE
ncbi:MAG: DNA replication initiator (Cdc21/Cdc54) [Parcubacteria bacterium 32_520]|nr:MAG: DNA replication initiator (Cdc21/Cdc54) [Parcubacteria bacterium 32_520]